MNPVKSVGVRRLLSVVVAVGLLAAEGCSDVSGTEGKEWITGEGRIVEVAPADRDAPASATGEDLDGRPLSLEDHRGTVVVVNVWASWCPPCRAEMPDVVELADSYSEDDVVFLGVNIRENGGVAAANGFVREFDVPFPSFYDPGSEVLLDLSDRLGPYSLPSTVVLDREGRLAALVLGEIPGQVSMRDVIDDVVAEPGDGAGA